MVTLCAKLTACCSSEVGISEGTKSLLTCSVPEKREKSFVMLQYGNLEISLMNQTLFSGVHMCMGGETGWPLSPTRIHTPGKMVWFMRLPGYKVFEDIYFKHTVCVHYNP